MNKKGFLGMLPVTLYSILGIMILLFVFFILFTIMNKVQANDFQEQLSIYGAGNPMIIYLNIPANKDINQGDFLAFSDVNKDETFFTESTRGFFTDIDTTCYYLQYQPYGILHPQGRLKSLLGNPLEDCSIEGTSHKDLSIVIPKFNFQTEKLETGYLQKNE